MRTEREIINDFNDNGGKRINEMIPFILEVLLDIRDLLQNPPMEISGTDSNSKEHNE